MKKIFKKNLTKILPILIVALAILSTHTVHADTRVFTFDNTQNPNRDADTHTVSFQVSYQLDKTNYNPGDKIYPSVTYVTANVACSNGVDSGWVVYPGETMQIGTPDYSNTITHSAGQSLIPHPDGIYYNSSDNTLYYGTDNDPDHALPEDGSTYTQGSDYNGSDPDPIYDFEQDEQGRQIYYSTVGGYENYGTYNYGPVINSLYVATPYLNQTQYMVCGSNISYLNKDKLYLCGEYGISSPYGGDTYQMVTGPLVTIPDSIATASNIYDDIEAWAPYTYQDNYVYETPIKSGTVVYGIDGIPGTINSIANDPDSILIPTDAKAGSYVDQLTLNLSYTSPTPTNDVTSGVWNTIQPSDDTPLPVEIDGSTVTTINVGQAAGFDGFMCYRPNEQYGDTIEDPIYNYGTPSCDNPGYTYWPSDEMCHYGSSQDCGSEGGLVSPDGNSCIDTSNTASCYTTGKIPVLYSNGYASCTDDPYNVIPSYLKDGDCDPNSPYNAGIISAYKNVAYDYDSYSPGKDLVPYSNITVQGGKVSCSYWCDVQFPTQIIMTEPFTVNNVPGAGGDSSLELK